jgi:hypothetical protein
MSFSVLMISSRIPSEVELAKKKNVRITALVLILINEEKDTTKF